MSDIMIPQPYLPPVMSDIVIDLYHGDKVSIDFSVIKQFGVEAVILKASQGLHFVDPTYAPRLAEARAAGLLLGAYHFLDGSGAVEQADRFLNTVGTVPEIRLVLDFEPNPASQATVVQAAVATTVIKSITGRFPIIYTDRYMLMKSDPTLSQCPLWLAEYGSRPVCPPGWSKWMLWQHTDGRVGSAPVPVPGIGPCDRSHFAGTVEELHAWWKAPS